MQIFFERREFACKCGCGLDTVDAELLDALVDIRTHFGQPVIVSSGCRCKTYNKRIGGADHSYHMIGRAADIFIPGISPAEIYMYADLMFTKVFGIIHYENFVHIDTRTGNKFRMPPV
jgi:uncharacterized protein YcbK (DUF882 family)